MLLTDFITFLFVSTSPQPLVTIRLDRLPHTVEKYKYVNFKPVIAAGIGKTSLNYLGFSGSVPSEGSIDWNKNLKKLWAQKLKIQDVSSATKKSFTKITYSYISSPAEIMTIEKHIRLLDNHLSNVKSSIKWANLCSDSHLSKGCESFKQASLSIDGTMLTAYSMTEIMPYQIGRQNYEMMNLYMRYAGRNYLDKIPSLGDPLLSMGRYQFTSYALGNDKDGPRSANKIAKYSDYPIPQSVIRLKGLSSDRAAYYFSVYNIRSLFKDMSAVQILNYNRFCRGKESLTEYIATAHHNPSNAKRNMIRWIDGKCKKPLVTYLTGDLPLYAKKTSINYVELKNRI